VSWLFTSAYNLPYLKISQVPTPSINDRVLNFQRDGKGISSVGLFFPDKASKNAKELMTLLTSRTDLSAGADEYFCILTEVNFVHPRQRLDVRFCDHLLFLSSQSASHRVPYDATSMVHRLEDSTPGEGHVREECIVVSLREGQSTYSHLVIKTGEDDPVKGEGIDSKWQLAIQFEQLFASKSALSQQPDSSRACRANTGSTAPSRASKDFST
jgi:hypothetical protein